MDVREFGASFAIFLKGDLKTKLRFAFDSYDVHGRGVLDRAEIVELCVALLENVDIRCDNARWRASLAAEVRRCCDGAFRGQRVRADEFTGAHAALGRLFRPLIALKEFGNGLCWRRS